MLVVRSLALIEKLDLSRPNPNCIEYIQGIRIRTRYLLLHLREVDKASRLDCNRNLNGLSKQ
ncbi:hypothetical protein ACWFPQ_21595 [Peribacillus butanolivorans]